MTQEDLLQAQTPPDEERLRFLIRQLSETEAELAALLGGVDSVFDQADVRPLLLRQAQADLAASEARYDRLVKAMSAMVFELAADGEVLLVSEASTAILGYSPAELLGRHWAHVLVPSDQRHVAEELRERLEAGDVTCYELVVAAKDGSRVVLELNTANHYLADRSLERIVGIATDITARKHAEAAVEKATVEKSQLIEELVQRQAELSKANDQLQALSRRLISVQEEERRKLARELHDEAGQYLTGLSLGMTALGRKAYCPPQVAEQLQNYQSMVSELATKLHEIVSTLHPTSLDQQGLLPAIAQFVAGIGERYGLAVKLVDVGMKGRLSIEIETAIYRLVQESLTNVVRHSNASRASVLLERRTDEVAATIEDNGVGFDLNDAGNRGRLGLVGMRERAEMVGGQIRIESAPGRGTKVAVTVPLPCEEA